MRNLVSKYQKVVFIAFALLFIGVTSLAFVTYRYSFESTNKFINYAISNHLWIMAGMVAMAVVFGFVWSKVLYKEIQSKEQTSKNMMDVVFRFLSKDERAILDHLTTNNGKATQADISRIHGMNKVKAFRYLKKMEEKKIVDINPHGKVRHIILKKDILEILKNPR